MLASSGESRLKEDIMYRFATTLIAGIVATVLVSGIAFAPNPAEAAKIPHAERVALEKAIAACKAEAKGMKFRLALTRKRQKYVQNCIIRSASRRGIDVQKIHRAAIDLPTHEIADYSLIFPRHHRHH
jgi:hypothetical protein